jgi:hypothetical protein
MKMNKSLLERNNKTIMMEEIVVRISDLMIITTPEEAEADKIEVATDTDPNTFYVY